MPRRWGTLRGRMTSSAFEHLSPAFPQRAAWGTAQSLRAWQVAALELYATTQPRDFLCVATPGAGKTTFALRVAHQLLHTRTVKRVVVVTPTEHLKTQWADAAARVGIHLDPGTGGVKRGRSRQFDGSVVTYAGVSLRAYAYEALCNQVSTLVIFDEIHHAGDTRSWGDGILQGFSEATRRLALTGTPFRSDDSPIPFVTYEESESGVKTSRADYTYGYREALADHVVRPVIFMNYGGQMRWRMRSGEVLDAELGTMLTKDLTAHAWRTALSPTGEWIPAVLRAADQRLTQVRRAIPDAGGLVIATNQTVARAYAKILAEVTGKRPTVILSDDAKAGGRIEEFAAGQDRWMVAVRMVSEGVDVPRLAVGVYATSTSTPLFFAQAVGRFVRSRRRGEVATVFLPTVPILLAHAATLERQRDHVLGRPRSEETDIWAETEALIDAANRGEKASDDLLGEFEALDSQATFDHVLFESQAFGMHAEPTSQDELDYLGLPGLLEPEQVSTLLAERQRRQLRRRERKDPKSQPEVPLHRALANQRKELNSLVAQLARLEQRPHSHVHADLRRECGGPPLAQATTEQVAERISRARAWLRR